MSIATAGSPGLGPVRGWRLTALLGVGLVGMSALVLVLNGAEREGVAAWVRATARSSALLFFLVYVARPLQVAWPTALSRFALRERRYLGVAVALSHGIHLLGIAWLARGWPTQFETSTSTVVVGGLASILLVAMAATSSDLAARRLGRRRWKLLHRSGLHLVWFVFFFTYLGRAGADPTYLPAAALLGLAALLRAGIFVRGRLRRAG